MTKVMFDEALEEYSTVKDTAYNGFSELKSALIENGYEVATLERTLEKPLGELCDVLVIAYPRRALKRGELRAVIEFVGNGGGLLLLGEWANLHESAEILSSISAFFDINFRNDRVVDETSMYERSEEFMKNILVGGGTPYLIKIKDFVPHEITAGIKEISFMAGCSLDADKNDALAYTSKESFGDRVIDNVRAIHEDRGPLIVTACKEYKKGRVVCHGDTNTFTNRFIGIADNKRFGLNIIKWLSKK